MTIGCVLAYTVMVYIQQEVNFALGYLIPGLTMMLAIIFFITAKNKFFVTPPKGTFAKSPIQTHLGQGS
jgi:dipeptide/tripeptide permease